MLDPEQLIRERAYHLWMQEGCPDGRADHHWHLAHQEVLSSLPRPAAPARRKRAPMVERAAAAPSTRNSRRSRAQG